MQEEQQGLSRRACESLLACHRNPSLLPLPVQVGASIKGRLSQRVDAERVVLHLLMLQVIRETFSNSVLLLHHTYTHTASRTSTSNHHLLNNADCRPMRQMPTSESTRGTPSGFARGILHASSSSTQRSTYHHHHHLMRPSLLMSAPTSLLVRLTPHP